MISRIGFFFCSTSAMTSICSLVPCKGYVPSLLDFPLYSLSVLVCEFWENQSTSRCSVLVYCVSCIKKKGHDHCARTKSQEPESLGASWWTIICCLPFLLEPPKGDLFQVFLTDF